LKVSIEHLGIAGIELWDVFVTWMHPSLKLPFFHPKQPPHCMPHTSPNLPEGTHALPWHPPCIHSTTSQGHPHPSTAPPPTLITLYPLAPLPGSQPTAVHCGSSSTLPEAAAAEWRSVCSQNLTKMWSQKQLIYGVQGPQPPHCGPHRLGDWSFCSPFELLLGFVSPPGSPLQDP
jgi:hypothetical protein